MSVPVLRVGCTVDAKNSRSCSVVRSYVGAPISIGVADRGQHALERRHAVAVVGRKVGAGVEMAVPRE